MMTSFKKRFVILKTKDLRNRDLENKELNFSYEAGG